NTGIIDADAHVVENERVWDFLEPSEKKYRPTFVPQQDNPLRGKWVLDGEFLGNKFPSPGEKQAEEHVKKFGRVVATPVESRELDDVSLRLKHMDDLGVEVQVLFNSMWISPLTSRPDAEIALSWGWNRWMANIWKQGQGRLRWTCVIPSLSPKEAVPQIRFAKENGAVGICIRPFEKGRMMVDPFFYPIYDEAQHLGLPITVHLANGDPELMRMLTNEAGGGFSTFRVPTITACYALIMSEIPRMFPNLKWGFIEVSSQWIPWVVHETIRRSMGSEHPVPSNPFREFNIYSTTQTDDDFPYVISYTGEENLLIGTDYGHGDTSSELNAISRFQAMNDLSAEVKRKILSDNPRAFYGI
ncbi:MAG: amidohydrolase family protein, partial [Deltaproteobacteria bacterium]|nr:amidohydrolase family protein [Deltaproteobacteria bacterium]